MIRCLTFFAVAAAVLVAGPSSAEIGNRKSAICNFEMAYVELADLKGKIPNQDLTQALDDNRDGTIDSDVWAQIQNDVQTEIDGYLGQRYTTPFVAPLPAVVAQAARVFAIEAVYARRGLAGEKSSYKINADAQRKKLAAIAAGDQPLAPEEKRAQPSGSAITEPSRTYSDRPAI